LTDIRRPRSAPTRVALPRPHRRRARLLGRDTVRSMCMTMGVEIS